MDPALDLPAVEYAQRSDPGRDPSKQINEDACGHRETRLGHLCVVCDGMGGHAAGREAAELALATIFEAFELAADGASPANVLRGAIEEASRRVFAMPTSELALGRPGSTVVAVLMHPRGTEVAHVGDSRAYLVHEGHISRVTRDHSVVQEMVDRGLLTLQQAAGHPDANRITRALGMGPEVEIELRPQPVHHVTGDAFVLCSDGLSDLVEDQEILDAVGDAPAAQAVGLLVDLANARGGHDNVTVLVLRARTSAIEAAGAGVAPTVAPTVAQTRVPMTTVVGVGIREGSHVRGERRPDIAATTAASQAAPPAPRSLNSLANAPLEPTLPPTTSRSLFGARFPPAAVAGLLLGGVAIAVVSALVATHFAERAPRRSVSNEPNAPRENVISPHVTGDAQAIEASSPDTNPIPLVADSVQILPPSPPSGEPLAPLEPGPTQHAMPRRSKKQ